MTTMRCSRCTRPVVDTKDLFGRAKIIVCEDCGEDDDPEFVTVRARAEGGQTL